MKTFFLEINCRLTCNLAWDIFTRLAATFGIHYGILYECNFTELLTLLHDATFDNVKVMKTFFFGNRLPFNMQSWDKFARLAAMFGIHCRIFYECSFTELLTLLRGTHFENYWCRAAFFNILAGTEPSTCFHCSRKPV